MYAPELDMDDDTASIVERIICSNAKNAIQGSATRDALLAELDLQLEGRLMGNSKQRWRNSCVLNDPMSRQAHLQLLAMVTQAQRKDPKWTVDANDPVNQDSASLMESWLVRKSNQYQLSTVLYDMTYICLRDPVCPMYVGWAERIRQVYPRKYHLVDMDNNLVDEFTPVSAEERDPNEVYKEVDGEPEDVVDHAGCEFRTCDNADFYVYPSDAQNIKKAIATYERMLLTEAQLWNGIEDYGYDEEAVEELVRLGPTHAVDGGGSLFEIRNEYDGTASAAETDARDGFYECFLCFTQFPRRNGTEKIDMPDEMKHKDIMCMICPGHDIVFQMTVSPYDERPYIMFNMLARPNRLLGIGAMQLIATIQEEATANLQLTIDSMNLEMSPVLVAPYEWVDKYSAFSIYPGAVLPEDVPNSLRPLDWNRSANPGLELQGALVDRGLGLVAAEGYGVMQPKVRKAQEVANVMQAADVKFDLFLQIIQTPMSMLAERIVALHLKFDPDMQETFMSDGKPITVTAETLRGDYRFIPTATSSTGTPEARLQITMAKIELLKEYIALMTQSNPSFWQNIWHAFRCALIDMDERNPVAYLGSEPQPPQPPPAPSAGAVPAQLQALVQNGVPPNVIQQLLQSAAPVGTPLGLSNGAIQNQ